MVTAGVVFLLWDKYKNKKKKCGCQDKKNGSAATTTGTTANAAVEDAVTTESIVAEGAITKPDAVLSMTGEKRWQT